MKAYSVLSSAGSDVVVEDISVVRLPPLDVANAGQLNEALCESVGQCGPSPERLGRLAAILPVEANWSTGKIF